MPITPKYQTNEKSLAASCQLPSTKIVRITVSEAARLFGVNPRTIRRAIAAGELRYIVALGRYKLHFGSVVNWSQRTATIKKKRDERGIGQWIDQWKITNPKFSPRVPSE